MFLQLAEEYRRAGALTVAAETCREGLKQHPKYWAARVALARACLGLGKAKEAVSELKKVLAVVPDNILAGKLLGQIYEKVGKPHKALETYQRLLPYDPDDPELSAKIEDLSASIRDAPPPAPAMVPEETPMSEAELPAGLPAHEDPPALEAAPAPPALEEGTAILEEPPSLEGSGSDFFHAASAPSTPATETTLPPEMNGELNEMSHDLGQELEQAPVDHVVPDTLDLTPSPDLLPNEIQKEAEAESQQEAAATPAPVEEPAEPEAAEASEPEEDVISRTMAELYYKQGHLDKAIETLERLMLMDQTSKEDEARLAKFLSERGDRLGAQFEKMTRAQMDQTKLETMRGWLTTIQSL